MPRPNRIIPCALCGKPFQARPKSKYCGEDCTHDALRRSFAQVGERILAGFDFNGPIPERRPDLGPCWIWTKCRQGAGYGQIGINRTTKLVHKVAFEIVYGPVPEGLELDHLCRTRACGNPCHLEAVTRRVNVLRGAAPMAVAHVTGICRNGHPFTAENTRLERSARGIARRCRQCARDKERRRRH